MRVRAAMILLVVGAGLTPGHAGAAPRLLQAASPQPYIPASLYPAGSRITFNGDCSNDCMNMAWDFDAAGEPLMHTYPQNVFLRQSGWMEQSWVQHGNQIAWFTLYESSYGTFHDGHQGNTIAYLDLRLMLAKWWHATLAKQQPSNILPDGVTGATETRIIRKQDGGPFVVSSAWWGPASEVEAIGFSTPRLMSRTGVRQMLAAQLRFAVHLPPPRPGKEPL